MSEYVADVKAFAVVVNGDDYAVLIAADIKYCEFPNTINAFPEDNSKIIE